MSESSRLSDHHRPEMEAKLTQLGPEAAPLPSMLPVMLQENKMDESLCCVMTINDP